MDEEEKVRRVMALYDAMGLKAEVDRAIGAEFDAARLTLDSIGADETQKTPLREMMETLNNRKK